MTLKAIIASAYKAKYTHTWTDSEVVEQIYHQVTYYLEHQRIHTDSAYAQGYRAGYVRGIHQGGSHERQ